MTTAIKRKRLRLPADNYLGRRLYFVTISCADRQKIFLDRFKAQWLLAHFKALSTAHGFRVHAYAVMPDHLHSLLEGNTEDSNLIDFIARFKQRTAHEARKRFGVRLWQGRFYDHVLRRDADMDAVAWYIWMNPVRKGLCSQPEDYPFSGSWTVEWPRTARPAHVWTPPWKNKPGQEPV